jgi:hypothetical protein
MNSRLTGASDRDDLYFVSDLEGSKAEFNAIHSLFPEDGGTDV